MQLSVLKENFPKVAIIALTATADKITRTDILNQLKLRDPKTFISSFDRPNLSLTIRRGLSKKEKIAAIVHFINRHHRQSGIIYCMSRKVRSLWSKNCLSTASGQSPIMPG